MVYSKHELRKGGPPMLKISDFSKLSRISIRMLRFYDEKDILKPSIVKENGYRYYHYTDLKIASHIQYLRYLGFGTSEIRSILEHHGNSKAIQQYLEMQLDLLGNEQRQIRDRMEALTKTIQKLKEEELMMNYQVEIKEIPEKLMMCRRDIIPSYEKEGLLWEGLCSELEKTNQKIDYVENGMSMAVFYDEGYKEADVDVEIRVEVKGTYQDTDHIQFKKIPKVKVASITFTGGYEHITDISYCIAKWISDHHYKICGPNFSIYHVGYAQKQNQEEFVTEICYPIA